MRLNACAADTRKLLVGMREAGIDTGYIDDPIQSHWTETRLNDAREDIGDAVESLANEATRLVEELRKHE